MVGSLVSGRHDNMQAGGARAVSDLQVGSRRDRQSQRLELAWANEISKPIAVIHLFQQGHTASNRVTPSNPYYIIHQLLTRHSNI